MYIRASAPDAPPLSDTTIGCFIRLFFWMAACIIRAIWSEAPPAPAATTISTDFVGSHAAAGTPANTIVASEPAQRQILAITSSIAYSFSFGAQLYRAFVNKALRHSAPKRHKAPSIPTA